MTERSSKDFSQTSHKNVNVAFLAAYLSAIKKELTEHKQLLEGQNALQHIFRDLKNADEQIRLMIERSARRAERAAAAELLPKTTRGVEGELKAHGLKLHQVTPADGERVNVTDVRRAAGVLDEHGTMDGDGDIEAQIAAAQKRLESKKKKESKKADA